MRGEWTKKTSDVGLAPVKDNKTEDAGSSDGSGPEVEEMTT